MHKNNKSRKYQITSQSAFNSPNKTQNDLKKKAQVIFSNAYELHQKGQINEAESCYREVLKLQPNHFDALQLLGTLFAQKKDSAQSLTYFDKAIEINPLNASVFNNRGIVLMDLKEPRLAVESYNKAIELKSDYPEVHSNKGNALQALNLPTDAVKSYEHSIALRPQFADTYNSLGVVLHSIDFFIPALSNFNRAALINPNFVQTYYNAARSYKELGDLRNALTLYDHAIKLNVNYLDAYNNKGNVLLELEQYDQALDCFDKALLINSQAPHLHNNKGNVFKELKKFNEALLCYQTALQIYPSYSDAHNNMGNLMQELNRFQDALICYDNALQHSPHFVDAINNKGVVLRELKQILPAIACYSKSIELNPQFAQGNFNLANALKEINATEDSKKYYLRTLKIDPNYQAAKWGIALSNVPTFLYSLQHLETSRLAYEKALISLEMQANDSGFLKSYKSVGLHQPFYLAYQERNNIDLMKSYAKICSKVMSHWFESENFSLGHSNTCGKIKLGIVSDQIRYHSVWNAITKGFIEHLDPIKFEIHIFYLSNTIDDETAFAKSRSTSFTQNLASLSEWTKCILDKEIDVILFPEIGMHALTTQIAHLRLAKLQLVSWGHPETTGIPTIDYFISSELFENQTSQQAYSEKLITLPSLGCTYSALNLKHVPIDLNKYGIKSSSVKLLCPGNLFKYSPIYDWVYPQIAKRVNNSQFIFFFKDGIGVEIFKKRLDASFANSGLNVNDYVVFMPWLNPQEFYGLMHSVDLFMDSLGFSGFNTAMQALECGLPIVTKHGGFLRGRFASGILNKMGMIECISHTDQDYIDLVVKVATTPELAHRLKQEIVQKRHILFNDLSPIRAFEEFLITNTHINP